MEESVLNSMEFTPTWIVAFVCFIIVVISLAAERGLHRLGKFLLRKGQQSVFEALQKIKAELMLLGFISLLLTAFQGVISNMCIPEHLTHFMLPCKRGAATNESETTHFAVHPSWSKRHLLSEGGESHHCKQKGMAQFMSLEALHQLHILIFVLAVVFVIFNATTMILGGIKVRRWKHWEESLRREVSKSQTGDQPSSRINQIHARHRQQFFKQHEGHSTIVGVIVSFLKQFYGSVTKSDYIALRHGFIMTHCPSNLNFDFHKYMLRTLEYEFKKVAGISWWLWMFVVVFLLVNLDGAHIYFWLSFLPLILLLLVGTKLEHIIMSLAEEIEKKEKGHNVVRVTSEADDGNKEPWVKPSDKHFWFERPSIVLYLIHFILFQNSFEIAFFFWVLLTYGIHSCILDKVGFIIPRLMIGMIVQGLCSYSTLPLYTIVTQMGSMFKPGILGPIAHESVENWLEEIRERSGHGKGFFGSNRIEMQNLASETREIIPGSDQTTVCIEGLQIP